MDEIIRLLGPLRDVQAIAAGPVVQIAPHLRQTYGGARWRKMKRIVRIEVSDGWIGDAEVHWFEAHGVGRVMMKVKRRLEEA